MPKSRIAVVGAGIAGLVAARALQRVGYRPRIYERSNLLGEAGAGLTLAPNAMHALGSIGLGPALAPHLTFPDRSGVRHWQTGELMISLARGGEMLEKFGAPYCHIHRADLHAVLAREVLAADPDALVPGADCRAVLGDATGVELEFVDGRRVRADVVIGADGVRSAVRASLFGADQPRFTGYIAFRGLVPMARLAGAMLEPPSCLATGPDRSFARYLIRDGQLVNFVGLAQRDGWSEEGWSIRASVDEMLREYEGWHENVRTIIRNTPDDGLFKWALLDRDPLPEWSRGRVTLMGDAAHPMLPFLGQGAGMGIEDGVVLARAFADSGSIDEGLRRYVAARRARTTWVMLKSREAGQAYHSGRSEHYQPARHVTAESLGIWAYNPATAEL